MVHLQLFRKRVPGKNRVLRTEHETHTSSWRIEAGKGLTDSTPGVNNTVLRGRCLPKILISTVLMVSRIATSEGWKGPTEKLDEFTYLIPKSYKPSMRTA